MDEEHSTQVQQLLQAIGDLADAEILALCYARQGPQERLWLYMGALRRRSGRRAQFASCLICFDLARQGDRTCQGEFLLLAETMRELAREGGLAAQLVGEDPYLSFVWELCEAALAEPSLSVQADPGLMPLVGAGAPAVPQVDLLSEADLPEIDDWEAASDLAAQQRRFEHAVDTFLGGSVGVPAYDPDAGFRLHGGRDVARTEQFLQQLQSSSERVPLAQAYRALVLLFYGTQMRARTLFGSLNPRRELLLRAGLLAFVQHAQAMPTIVGVMGDMHADAEIWPKVVDTLVAYVRLLARAPQAPRLACFRPLQDG